MLATTTPSTHVSPSSSLYFKQNFSNVTKYTPLFVSLIGISAIVIGSLVLGGIAIYDIPNLDALLTVVVGSAMVLSGLLFFANKKKQTEVIAKAESSALGSLTTQSSTVNTVVSGTSLHSHDPSSSTETEKPAQVPFKVEEGFSLSDLVRSGSITLNTGTIVTMIGPDRYIKTYAPEGQSTFAFCMSHLTTSPIPPSFIIEHTSSAGHITFGFFDGKGAITAKEFQTKLSAKLETSANVKQDIAETLLEYPTANAVIVYRKGPNFEMATKGTYQALRFKPKTSKDSEDCHAKKYNNSDVETRTLPTYLVAQNYFLIGNYPLAIYTNQILHKELGLLRDKNASPKEFLDKVITSIKPSEFPKIEPLNLAIICLPKA